MLRREGWVVNAKRIYRLYTEDGLAVRTKLRKKIARRSRVPALRATRPNEKWSMDFGSIYFTQSSLICGFRPPELY
jgi:putative transposase